MDRKLENDEKELKIGFLEYLESLFRYWILENRELKASIHEFWMKMVKIDYFSQIECIVVYHSWISIIETVIRI